MMLNSPNPKGLQLVHTADPTSHVLECGRSAEDETQLAACREALDALGVVGLMRNGSEGADHSYASQILDLNCLRETANDVTSLHNALLKVWQHTSLAPYLARRGEGTDILVAAFDFDAPADHVLDHLAPLVLHRWKTVTLLVSPDDANTSSLTDLIASKFASLELQILPIEVGAAELASSPQDFDVVIVDECLGGMVSNIISQAIDYRGFRPVMTVFEDQVQFTTEPVARVKYINQTNPHDVLPALQALGLLLRANGKSTAAARLHNALMTTLELRIFPLNDRVDFLGQSRLKPLPFIEAVVAQIGHDPKVLPGTSLADHTPHRRSVGRAHLSLVS